MGRLSITGFAFFLVGVVACIPDNAALGGPDPAPQSAAVSAQDSLLSDAAETIKYARSEATKDKPPNTKHSSSADGMAIYIWVRDAGPDLRAKLAIALCESSKANLPIDSNLSDASGSLVLALLEDKREDLAIRMLASNLPMHWVCSLGSLLQLHHLQGNNDAGLELLLDAYDDAVPTRQAAIEKMIAGMLGPYLPAAPKTPTGHALIRWARDWYVPRKDRLLPNDDWCGNNDFLLEDPELLELSTALERAISFEAARIASGAWRPARYSPKSLLPACVPEEARVEPSDGTMHPLEQSLQVEGSFVRIVSVRAVESCGEGWWTIDTILETSVRGKRFDTPNIKARFLLFVGNGRQFVLLPETARN